MTTQTLTLTEFLLARVSEDEEAWRDLTLQVVAAVYADHPDYRQGWAL